MKFNLNTTLIIVGTLVLAAGGYWYVSQQNVEAPLSADSSQNQARAEFQSLITQLPASFDTSVFNDPNFMALTDITVDIIPETTGRLDPFATLSK